MSIDYDRVATEYARHRQIHPGVLEQLISHGRVGRGSRVLDVGCGTGNYAVALEQSTGCQCWGIEPSAQMLAQATARSQTVEFKQGQAEALDYRPGFFDLVVSVDVIHHLQSPAEYYRQAAQVLKTGGRVCTVTDSEDIIARREPLSTYFPETVPVELARYPRIVTLREYMRAAGFRDLCEQTVELAYPVEDIVIYQAKAFSCLHLIPVPAFERGIAAMQAQVERGRLQCVARYLLLWGTK